MKFRPVRRIKPYGPDVGCWVSAKDTDISKTIERERRALASYIKKDAPNVTHIDKQKIERK